MKETELYEPVKKWMESIGYEVFAEVSPKYVGGRADVVGRHGKCIAIVEMKTSLSMELLDQAVKWYKHANYVYVAVPSRTKPVHRLILKILREYGIGVIEVHGGATVRITQPARFVRTNTRISWDKELLPEHKTWVQGGHCGGGYVTPYKITIDKVKQYLRYRDWTSINDILNHCETHYSSPKPSLSKALREFEQDWCETKKVSGKLMYRMKKAVRGT